MTPQAWFERYNPHVAWSIQHPKCGRCRVTMDYVTKIKVADKPGRIYRCPCCGRYTRVYP